MSESSSGNFAGAQIGIDPITEQHKSAAPSCHGLLPEFAVSIMRNSHCVSSLLVGLRRARGVWAG